MGKRQTRRSVSMNGDLYYRLEMYCACHDLAVSGFVGEIVTRWLDDHEIEPTLCGQTPATCAGASNGVIDRG